MGPDIAHLVQQLGWPAVTLVFFGWISIKVGRFFGPLMRDLFQAHIDLMRALQQDAADKTEILKSCRAMLVGISEKIDA